MGHLSAFARRLLDAILVAGRPRTRWRQRLVVLGIALVLITAWQLRLAAHPERLDGTYKVTAAAAANASAEKLFFFRYHLGLYPLTSDLVANADTTSEAERLLHADPTKLHQESPRTFRAADHGRGHLFYVDKWLGGDARKPSLKPANELGFILALDLLFLSAWWVDWSFLGGILVLFFGSNPLQLFSAYGEESCSSWPITALVLLLALNLPLLAARPRRRWLFVAAAASGLVLAAIRTWQSDVAVLLVSALVTSALAVQFSWRERGLAILTAVVLFGGASWGHDRMIAAKVASTRTALVAAGASPAEGLSGPRHDIWHRVWCGLGDFDPPKGHECQKGKDDEATARNAVLGDIRRDPLSYLGILVKRVRRIATEVTPIEIAIAESKPTGAASLFAFLALPLAFLLHRHRRGFFAKLILFPLPLALIPLLVDSSGGLVLFSSFHIVAAAVIVLLVLSGARARLGRGRSFLVAEPAAP